MKCFSERLFIGYQCQNCHPRHLCSDIQFENAILESIRMNQNQLHRIPQAYLEHYERLNAERVYRCMR